MVISGILVVFPYKYLTILIKFYIHTQSISYLMIGFNNITKTLSKSVFIHFF